MRSMKLLALALTASLLAAGCAGGGGQSQGSTSSARPPPAPTPEADDTMGSVSGRIVDDEQRPVIGARVLLRELSGIHETDEAGQFTFNGIEPGVYTLYTEKLGFESLAQKVAVEAGQVATLTLTLRPIAVPDVAYYVSIPKTSLINLDNVWLSFYVRYYANLSAHNSIRCGPCEFVLHLPKRPVQALTESIWAAGSPAYVNQEITVYYYRNWTDASPGTMVRSDYMLNRESTYWTEAQIEQMRSVDKLFMYVYGGGVLLLGNSVNIINYQHRVDVWTTFAYVEELPDEFTRLPPA